MEIRHLLATPRADPRRFDQFLLQKLFNLDNLLDFPSIKGNSQHRAHLPLIQCQWINELKWLIQGFFGRQIRVKVDRYEDIRVI